MIFPAPRAARTLIMGRNGAVASNHPLATQAGLDVLRDGGNAIDAAVSVSLTLGVVEPAMSGLGGDGFYHVHIAASGQAVTYNGTGPAPAAATPERFARGMPVTGAGSASVPGMVAGLDAMHAAHGARPWNTLFEAAIAHARHGFAATHAYRHFATSNAARMAQDPGLRATLLPAATVPGLGTLLRQPDLAATLEQLAAEGAEGFYRGALARRFAAALHMAGALITAQDLAAMQADPQAPIAVTYRGYEVRQTPPNSTGFTLLQMLMILERSDLAAADPALRHHLMIEAKKLAFLDREHGGDPRHVAIPLEHLLSDAHADALSARIDPERAADLPIAAAETPGDTTYFAVVDAAGNAVSAIQSINSAFGAAVVAGDTGILLNNRMAYWHLAAGHPNRLAPGKRVRHTMNAPMVFRNGALWAVLGTPGADNQVQVNLQVLVNLIDGELDPQAAVEQPRWTHSQPGQGANWPHDGDGALTIEAGFPDLPGLERRGHRLHRIGPLEGACSVQVIRILDNGVRAAGSDPRRDGWAGAY